MTEIDRRHVEVVAAIADAGSITGAARQLHVSQSAVSRTLAQAERIVGAPLFDRSTHHVAITDAGNRFVSHGGNALSGLDQAVSSARAALPALTLGYTWGTRRLVTMLLVKWAQAFPATKVEVQSLDNDRIETSPSTPGPDIAVTRSSSDRWTRSTVVATEQRWAAMPQGHPLCQRTSVSVFELADDPLVLAHGGTTSLDLWPSDQQPQTIVRCRTIDDWFVEISASRGIGVTVDPIALHQIEHDVHFVPIHDAPHIDVFIALREPTTHPLARSLFDIASNTESDPPRERT